MPACTVCTSPHGSTVDALHVDGRRVADIARAVPLPYQAILRHTRKHTALRMKSVAVAARVGGTRRPQMSADGMGPVGTFEAAFGFTARDYQRDYLTEESDLIWLKGRQIGASQCAAALAIYTARAEPGSDSVIVSATQRQSSEVAVRARLGLAALGEALAQDSATVLRLANGSRILSLAQSARAVRGYSARLLVLDEAAFIPNDVWNAARPMTSATGGRTVVQSTPGVPAGWFYELVKSPPPSFASMRITSEESGIVSLAFLARERGHLDPVVYAQEYLGQFASSGSLGRWFDEAGFDARVNPDEQKLAITLANTEQEDS